MSSLREQWLILISTPLYIIFIAAELLVSNYRHRKLYTFKDTAQNVYLMFLNAGIDLLFRSLYFIVWYYCYQHRILTITNSILYWVALFVAEDFLYYWLHRFDHEVRFFWATHVTHHSS